MIIEYIVSQHAEESSFLWLLRDAATKEPHYSLDDLHVLEQRIDAHLDGLRVAGRDAWPFCHEGLRAQEAGEVFTAAYTALDNAEKAWLSQTVDAVEESPEVMRGLISALGWVPKTKLQGHVVNWLRSGNPLHRQIGLAACATQRVDCGEYLTQGLQDADTGVRARALRSVGEMRHSNLCPATLEHLGDDDTACRFWAAWSATLLGDKAGLSALQSFFDPQAAFHQRALSLGLRAMDKTAAMHWTREQATVGGYARSVVAATGIIGDPASIPWLISLMAQPELSRLAGESFSLLTGLDLAYDDMETDPPDGFVSEPAEDADNEEIAMDEDEELPWPDPHALTDWWHRNQERYPIGTRHLCGHPITRDHCFAILKTGSQRQRRAAALELAILEPDQALFNCSATARDQSQLLNKV